ncbi:hypothetical protein PJI12_28965, partial [Mycobacterium kansasii]
GKKDQAGQDSETNQNSGSDSGCEFICERIGAKVRLLLRYFCYCIAQSLHITTIFDGSGRVLDSGKDAN